jgi:hypothetical protein
MGDQPIARPLSTHRTTQTQNKCTETSMPRVRFEPTIPVFEGAKTAYALDCTATVIGYTVTFTCIKSEERTEPWHYKLPIPLIWYHLILKICNNLLYEWELHAWCIKLLIRGKGSSPTVIGKLWTFSNPLLIVSHMAPSFSVISHGEAEKVNVQQFWHYDSQLILYLLLTLDNAKWKNKQR